MNERQFQQTNANLMTSRTRNQPTASPLVTSRPEPAVVLCECGEPKLATYVDILGGWVHTKWCMACEDKHKIIDLRIDRINRRDKLRRSLAKMIPELYLNAHINKIDKGIMAHLKTKKAGQGIYLWGGVGRGKTYAAAALLRNFIVRGRRASRVRFRDLIDEIQRTFDGSGSTASVCDNYLKSELLCIEDVGTSKGNGIETDFNQDILLKIIDNRVEKKLTTIITSNLSLERVADSFGPRIYSRLRTFMVLELTGSDRRQ